MLPLKKETPIIAIVSRACDTIAITLPIMTPCITSNLVFRILSPGNGRGGRGIGLCRGCEWVKGHRCRPTFSQWFYFSPLCDRAMLIEAIYNGHRLLLLLLLLLLPLLLLLLPSTTGLRGTASTKSQPFLFLFSLAMQHGRWRSIQEKKVQIWLLALFISLIPCNNHWGNWAVMIWGTHLLTEGVFYCLLLSHLQAVLCSQPNLYCLHLRFFTSKCKCHQVCFTAVVSFAGNLIWVIYLSLAKPNTLGIALAIGSDSWSSYKAR